MSNKKESNSNSDAIRLATYIDATVASENSVQKSNQKSLLGGKSAPNLSVLPKGDPVNRLNSPGEWVEGDVGLLGIGVATAHKSNQAIQQYSETSTPDTLKSPLSNARSAALSVPLNPATSVSLTNNYEQATTAQLYPDTPTSVLITPTTDHPMTSPHSLSPSMGEKSLSRKSLMVFPPSSSKNFLLTSIKPLKKQNTVDSSGKNEIMHTSDISFSNQINTAMSRLSQTATIQLSASYKNLAMSKNVEEFLKLEKKYYLKSLEEPKILILGSSDSGKSTLLKQLKIMHSKFTDEEIHETKFNVYSGIALSLLVLVEHWCKANQATKESDTDASTDLVEVYSNLLTAAEYMERDESSIKEFVSYSDQAQKLWNEHIIQDIFDKGQHGLPDTTPYFLNELARIMSPDYTPSDQDILNVRVVTKQVCETVLTIRDVNYHFYDVSGMRKDRVHWLQFFDNCNIVLYVTSLSSYDQVLVEDPTVNRMVDSLVLLEQMANHKLLINVPFIIFLNKKDLFKKKLKTKPITIMFPDYIQDPKDPNLAAKFIIQKFTNQCPPSKKVTCHLTCATDKASMQVIISQVILNNLQKSYNTMFGE